VAEALGVLAAIIFVHECGHFGAARALGVHVTKFAVGFGPRLLTFRDAEVEYSLGAVPLGGFVAFPDDDPDSPWPADDPDLLRNRPLAHRAAVVVAGVVANVICAFALLTTQSLTVGQLEQTYLPGVRVPVLLGVSAAERAGVRVGDIITAIDGDEVAPTADSVSRLVNRIKYAPGKPLEFTVTRAGEAAPLKFTVTPDVGSSGGRIGVQLEGALTGAVLAVGLRTACLLLSSADLLHSRSLPPHVPARSQHAGDAPPGVQRAAGAAHGLR
jgi:membrane-associated protease RseP (regulator of RpoE activity)